MVSILTRTIALASVFLLCILSLVCTPTGPEIIDSPESIQVADDVVDTNLMPWIEQLARPAPATTG